MYKNIFSLLCKKITRYINRDKNYNINGKVVIITGSSRGIGKEAALLFAKNHCKVVICSRNKLEIKNTKKEIEEFGTEVLAIKSDISNISDVNILVNKTLEKFGKINILINNAGVCYKNNIENSSHDEINSSIDINLKGAMYLIKEVLPHIKKEKNSKIINISSYAGKYGMPNFSAYCATKFALMGITKSISKELPGNVKIYSICPKSTDTKMYRDIRNDSDNEKLDSPDNVAKEIFKASMPNYKVKSGKSIFI